MVTALASLNAKRQLTAQPGEDYGLADPAVTVTVTAAGETNTFAFGTEKMCIRDSTITEKGYGVAPADLERGLTPVLAMGKVTALLYERFKAGKLPLTVQSMDNCSHNGDKVKNCPVSYTHLVPG